METILTHTQQLVYTLVSLMPSAYQRENLKALLGLFLEVTLAGCGYEYRYKSGEC